MAQKERFAWVWLIALTATLGSYFVFVEILGVADSTPSFLTQISGLAIALTALAAIVGINALVAFARQTSTLAIETDERDQLIEQRSTKAAYHVLIAGMIFVGCVLPFSKGGWEIVNTALLVIAISEVTRCVLIVRGYRRGVRV